MAVSATVTPAKIFQDGEVVTISELNKLGTPTVDIAGAVGSLTLTDGSVTNAKVAASTGIQLNKLETGSSEGQVVLANSSNVLEYKTVSGDVSITSAGETAIGAGKVTTGMLEGDITEAKLIAAVVSKLLPAGTICQFGGEAAPTGWLLCDGTPGKDSLADDTLAALFGVIGTRYGGSGADDFQLPDFRGRVPVGVDGSAGRLSSDDTLAADGGVEEVTISANQLPEHEHPNTPAKTASEVTPNTYGNPWINREGGGYTAEAGTPSAASAMHSGYSPYGFTGLIYTIKHTPSLTVDANVTDNVPTNLLQPYLVVEYIIKL